MFSDAELSEATRHHTTERLWVWQALCAALFVLWLVTLSFGYFRSQLVEWQAMGLLKDQLIQGVQELARNQQTLAQKIQALEKRGEPSPQPPQGQ